MMTGSILRAKEALVDPEADISRGEFNLSSVSFSTISVPTSIEIKLSSSCLIYNQFSLPDPCSERGKVIFTGLYLIESKTLPKPIPSANGTHF